ncbi:MAG: hypothetical protein HIU81_12580, partial [Acidobacteria bacterium]|nr:hypothetical protein [Acidobacteriota bacterium]
MDSTNAPTLPAESTLFHKLVALVPKIWRVDGHGETARRGRADVRLVPCAVAAWCTAFFAASASATLLSCLAGGFGAGGAVLLGVVVVRRQASIERSTLMLVGLALVISAAVCGVSLVEAQRNEALARAIPEGAQVKGIAVVLSNPREAMQTLAPGKSWLVDAELISLEPAAPGQLAPVRVLVTIGGTRPDFGEGTRLELTGKVRHGVNPGSPYFLALSSSPITLRSAAASQDIMVLLRAGLSSSAHHLPGDAAGLLPGMVAGDRSGVDPGLDTAMKRVGLTHLTAVSGANCTIILTA